MAEAEASSLDTDSKCHSCRSEEAWYICLDCSPSHSRLCKKCYKRHNASPETAQHRAIDLLEPTPAGTECKKHKGRKLELLCTTCKVHLCVKCAHSKTCQTAAGDYKKHETELLEDFLLAEREKLKLSDDVAAGLEAGCEASIAQLDQTTKELTAHANRTDAAIVEHGEKVITAIKHHIEELRGTVRKTEESTQSRVATSREDLKHFLENLKRSRYEARKLRCSQSETDIIRLAPSVIARLTDPFSLPIPTLPTVKLTLTDVSAGLNKMVGSLSVIEHQQELGRVMDVQGTAALVLQVAASSDFTFIEYPVLKVGYPLQLATPYACCLVDATSTRVMLGFYKENLYAVKLDGTSSNWSRIWDSTSYRDGLTSVCTIPGTGQFFYQGQGSYEVGNTHITHFYEIQVNSEGNVTCTPDTSGDRHIISPVSDISYSPTSSKLAVVDNTGNIIYIYFHYQGQRYSRHPQGDSFRITRSIDNNSGPGDSDILHSPHGVEWSSDGNSLYVTSWTHYSAGSVMKLQIEPTVVTIWKKGYTFSSDRITLSNGRLYVLSRSSSQQVTVLAEKDGAIIKTIECPGQVMGMSRAKDGKVELIHQRSWRH